MNFSITTLVMFYLPSYLIDNVNITTDHDDLLIIRLSAGRTYKSRLLGTIEISPVGGWNQRAYIELADQVTKIILENK